MKIVTRAPAFGSILTALVVRGRRRLVPQPVSTNKEVGPIKSKLSLAVLGIALGAIALPAMALAADQAVVLKSNAKGGMTASEARALAEEAWLFGLPLVMVEKHIDYTTYTSKPEGHKAPINQFTHYRAFVDASNRAIVGFNADHLYSLASLDLSKEPIVLSIPDMGKRYWLMQLLDAWNGVPAAPGSRTLGGKARNFLIVGPDFKGTVPKDMEVLKSPTNLTMIGGRTYCAGPSEYALVNKLQDQYRLTPLSAWGKSYSPPDNVKLKDGVDGETLVNKQVMALTPDQFFGNLNRLLVLNPAYPADKPMLKKLEQFGIKPGAPFSTNNLSAEVRAAIAEGVANAKARMAEEAKKLGTQKNNWNLTYDMGRYGTRYAYRAAWTFIGIGGNVAEDALYPLALNDGDGKPLNGDHAYTLTFKKGEWPPVDGLWSITVYDLEGYLVANPLNRYAIGDRSNMKPNQDGSLTVYIQGESPGVDKESNWLPAPLSGPFKIAMRLYAPKKVVIDGKWVPPAVKRER